MPTTRRLPLLPLALALGGGLAAGVLDLGADEVQGPALVVMLGAFAGAFAGAPGWAAAIAAVAGLFAAHFGALAVMHADAPSAGMLVALVPALVAAYAGRATAAVVGRVGDALPRAGTPGSRVLLGAALTACAAAGLAPVWATLAARAQPVAWWVALWWQLATLVAWAGAAPWVVRRARAGDAERPLSAAAVARDAALVVGVAGVHGLALVALTRALFVPLGPASFVAAAVWAFAAYLPLDALAGVLVAAIARASDAERLATESARRTAALTAAATEGRLAALTAQLRPHFLFNALNTALVLARRGDAPATARVLGDLAELLRYVLAAGDAVRLDDELAFVARYLDVERVRFPDRLQPTIDASPEARDALVPRLVLQPLVENALKHGVAGRIGAGVVRLRAWCESGSLRVTVTDDGPGPRAAPADGGVGLANTRARLAALYGTAASLDLRAGPDGGAVAELRLPLRRAEAA
ncbi:histidine kinase [Gemmatirosa kalamazoonensis]|uniref:histidine kinase n=1 Tax=Gemmatirosa kalamazoonensis TaxID=861299 RepID=UPI0011DD01D2|nr:histidine kinase [Gemmatirosa kalamazoonensis]